MRCLLWVILVFASFALGAEPNLVRQYDPVDLTVRTAREYANPFRDVRVRAVLTSPTGKTVTVPGFYNGDGKWIVRASFGETGAWSAAISSEPANPELQATQKVQVSPSGKPGPIYLDSQRRGFVRENGSPFYYSGDTCYPLLGLNRETQLLPYIKKRKEQGFSHIRFQAPMIEARFPELWAWGGTAKSPDLDRLNPEYFAHFDQVMKDLRENGMGAEIILESFYPGGAHMRDPSLWTAARERDWLQYVVARYAAFDNIVHWTLANEFETHPDGNYRLDEPGDPAWARNTAAFVKSIDTYHHPVTIHPYSSLAKQVEMFGKMPEIDFLMVQEHGVEAKVERYLADGDGSGLEEKILSARAAGKVVVDGEYGYEWDGVTTRGSNTTSDLVRKHAWRIRMGGGHFSSGFRSTVYNFANIQFDVSNGGRPGAEYVAILNRFFRDQTRFWELRPCAETGLKNALCLRGDDEYVIYDPDGADVTIDLSSDKKQFTATWIDPLTGTVSARSSLEGGQIRTLRGPGKESVLHIRATLRVASPADGGWPRLPKSITRDAGDEFTVDAAGHNRYLHVEVDNVSASPERVKLRGFIKDFGRLRDRSISPDQYLYVKAPGGPWKRVYRDGDVLTIYVPPGRTQVATVPGFSYDEYQRYVESLTDPRVKKEVVLSSDGGRYRVYRLRIKNPCGHNKLKIGFCRTNHAYERAGYFMAQGAIEWLLSGDPAANLDHIEWTIYPTLDSQAIHDGQDYTEYNSLLLDDGRTQQAALWDPKTGEIPAQHFHVLTDQHMWEVRDYESYKYNDPYAPSGRAGNGKSDVEKTMLAFWPYWYEFGTDQYDHENKWNTTNARAEQFGGALVTHLELPFYGKDDIDPRDRLREQGRMWARSHSQAFLRMQQEHRYWTDASEGGPVDTGGAILLPLPASVLLESLKPSAGKASQRPLRLFHEEYQHGIGMTGEGSVSYQVPAGATSFRAMAGVDDADLSGGSLRLQVLLDGREIWQSPPLKSGERAMAYLRIAGGRRLTLQTSGKQDALADWGGAKFILHDPEFPHSK